MKKVFLPNVLMLLVMALTLALTSCQEESDLQPGTKGSTEIDTRSNPNSKLYPPGSHPFGQSYGEWSEDFWVRLMAFDCETIFSPEVYPLNQDDPNVFFLSGSVGTYNVDVTVPREKAIFTPIINYINDYPCPDPDFQPEPGQSLEEFLSLGAAAAIDLVEDLAVTLDGVALEDLEDYRFQSGLFYFTGNPELPNCFDPCVTGTPQPAAADGYYLMFKKMSPGQHTLHLSAEMPAYGLVLNGTFNITVE